jgi:glycerol-3-phosphate dehydrogenase
MYDILAGKENMESSYLMNKGKALETFPMLKSDGLVGALVYYDGGVPPRIHSHMLSNVDRKVSTTMHE